MKRMKIFGEGDCLVFSLEFVRKMVLCSLEGFLLAKVPASRGLI